MALWIPIAILAAFLQNLRSAMQKHMSGSLGGAAATYARFVYGLPFAALFFCVAMLIHGAALMPGPVFALGVMVGGLGQILATAALIASFGYAGFAVGTAFSKTEPVIAALVGALILGEAPSLGATLAILICVAGVFLATFGGGAVNRRAALYGVGSAAFFALSAVSYRAASLSLGDAPAFLRATETLTAATLFQTLAMGAWMRARTPTDLRAVMRAWRPGLPIGAAGAAASACWFVAFTLEPVAHVRTLGQIEFVFTVAASLLIFGERPSAREWLGAFLVILGVIALLRATAGGG